MRLFGTVLGPGEAEQTIERSRFICYVSPAESREEAEEFFAAIRKKHKDATHNVPAMVLGDKMQIQWASDDGEPQGTSGAPMAQMLVSMGLTNVAVIVTRYFGGIKLGTGGLVRAYTSSLKLGLEAAGIGGVYEMSVLKYEMDYAAYSKL
ncbi:MAG: YigZ family protein, partial [Firmicutes bacterium]|nr:YigZ family protein [Bacillota bacterium]